MAGWWGVRREGAARRCYWGLVVAACMSVVLLSAPHVSAQSSTAPPDLPPELEEVAIGLDKRLICPVCPGETINQSQATLAKQMRVIVRERLLQGQSEQEIIDYFVSVYGNSVLAEPPRQGFGLTAWIVPPVALAVGAALLALVFRAMRRTAPALPPSANGPGDDAPLPDSLRLVDQELGEEKV